MWGGQLQRRPPYQSPPASEPTLQSANSQPASSRVACSSANAATAISSTPSATAVSPSERTIVRMPGVPSAPVRAAPGSRCAGRQRRDSGRDAEPQRAGRLERDGGQVAHLRRDRRREHRGQQRPDDEHELEQERVERERGVDAVLPDERGDQRAQRRARAAARSRPRRTRARSPPRARARRHRRHQHAAGERREHRHRHERHRLADPVDDAAHDRGREADAEARRRGDDADRRVVEVVRAQEQDQREHRHAERQPPDEGGRHQRRQAGDAEQLSVTAQAHRPGSVRIGH